MTEPPKAPPPDAPDDVTSLGDLVRSQASQIAQLLAALEAQGKMLARTFEVRAEVAPAAVTVAPREAVTFADLLPRYLRSLGAVTWLDVAKAQMRHVLAWFAPSVCFRAEEGRRHKVAVLGPDMLIADMRAYHWEDFREWLKDKHPAISPQVRDLTLIRARAMLNWAVEGERIPANPFADVKKEHRVKKRGTRIMDDSVEKMRQVASPVAWAYLLAICDGGMRPGEARLLQWSQIDAETGKVPLDETQTKGKKARPAWVTPRCLEAFAALPRRPGNPYVFASPQKSKRPQPYSKAAMWRHYKAAALKAGLQPRVGDGAVHAHDGRRGFATKLIQAGASMHKVQKLLGHSSISTTEWYVDMEDDDLEEAHSHLATAKRRVTPGISNPPDADNSGTKK